MTANKNSAFVSGDWHVQSDALVYGPGSAAEYRIEKNELPLAREDGASFWIMQMIEKNWVDMEEFTPAFRRSLELYDVEPMFDWKRTENEAFAHVYREFCDAEAERRLGQTVKSAVVKPSAFGEQMILADRLAENFWRPLRNPENL